jgi:hypothetical protein
MGVDTESAEQIEVQQNGDKPAAVVVGRLHLEVAFGDATFAADGEGGTVLRAFEAFKEHDASHPRHRSAPKQTTPEPPREPEQTPPDGGEPKTESRPLPVFLKDFILKTNFETALAIAVWSSRQTNGLRQFDKDSLGKLWSSSGDKVPGNVGAELNRASSHGWLTKVARGKFDLSSYGEEHLETLRRSDKK